MKIDWKRKLTSRKFWLALAGMIAGLIIAFNGEAETAETVTGCIMQVASVVAYIIGEGLTDAASIKNETTNVETGILIEAEEESEDADA